MELSVIRSKMSLVYWWTHWFWITAIICGHVSATPLPMSSYETISTSLKSALIQNDNTFQSTGGQQKVVPASKPVPITFETSDTDDVFGGAGEVDAEAIARNQDFLATPSSVSESPAKVENKENIPSLAVAALNLPNAVDTTNNSAPHVATTMLTTVTESTVIGSSIKTSTTMQTTKLIKVDKPQPDEHILSVKSLNLTNSEVAETNQSDPNDTVEIVMTDDANATEVSEFSERKSKGLLGYSEEAKVVNNISSRSTLQVVSQSQSSTDDRLSSEALFDTDEENGGITIGGGIIAVICVGIVGSLSAFSIMFVYVYRRRYLNKPQTLSEPDSSGYIDESSIRDNSDELYSLDNDSFLNSLEAMTIQNYWTDSVKHTKL